MLKLVFLRTYLSIPQHKEENKRIRRKHLCDHKVGLTRVCVTLLVPEWKLEIEVVASA